MSLKDELIPGNLNFFHKEANCIWGVGEVLMELIGLSTQFQLEGSWTNNDYAFILASSIDETYLYHKGDIGLCYIHKDDVDTFIYTKRLLYERTEIPDEGKALRFLADQAYSMNGIDHATFLRGELKRQFRNADISALTRLDHVFDYIDQRYANGGFANG